MTQAAASPASAVISAFESARRRRSRVFWIAVGVLWVGFVALLYWFGRYGSWHHGDFDVYYEAAGYFAQGVSPYFGTIGPYYLYPPLLAQLLIPLAHFDPLTAWHLWFALNVVLLVGTTALFSRHMPPTLARFVWLTPLLFEPLLDSFYVGQVTILIFALLTGAWAARRDGHPWLAGALIALAAWIKVYPALIVLYFLWKRDWRVVDGIAVAGVALAAFQVMVSGVQPFLDSFGILFGLAGGGQNRIVMNASILGFTSQLFITDNRVIPLVVNPTLYLISRLALTGVVLVVLGYLSYQQSWRHPLRDAGMPDAERFDLEFSLAVLTAMLLSPTLWASGMPPLLLCFWLVWGRGGRIARYLVGFALVILSIHSWMMMGYGGMAVLHALILSFGFYALATLWGVNAALLGRKRRETV